MLAEEIKLEIYHHMPCPVLYFPGLEIRLYQRRVLRDGAEINLTRLEYGTLTIEPNSKNPTYIKAVLGVGYKFNG